MKESILNKITKVYDALYDEVSKSVFNAKFDLLLDKDENKFLEWFLKENKEICCPELEQYENGGEKNYIIFGMGSDGKRTGKILKACHKNIIAWCDNNRKLDGKPDVDFRGIKRISPGELVTDYRDASVIIATRNYMHEILQQLLMVGFPRDNILVPENGFILGTTGEQYFDVFEPEEGEVFVDAGCWDGCTSEKFVAWCNGNYSRIYAFEPDSMCWPLCEKTFREKNIEKVSFVKKGVWGYTDSLYLKGVGDGSTGIFDKPVSSVRVPVTSIDDVLSGEKVTFIKMDVEGSELQALEGARKSIEKYRPRMAICVYHKPQDIWELADYILRLNPDYRLLLRHYTTCNFETVLYAI